jgi:hypothetical protein
MCALKKYLFHFIFCFIVTVIFLKSTFVTDMSPATAFCQSVPDGVYPDVTSNDPAQFIECYQHVGFVSRCTNGQLFSPVVSNCVASAGTTPTPTQPPTQPPVTAAPATTSSPINPSEYCRSNPVLSMTRFRLKVVSETQA